MTLFDENPTPSPDAESSPLLQSSREPAPLATQSSADSPDPQLAGDPISFAGTFPMPALVEEPSLPEDLRIPWSWLHLFIFVLFGFFSLFIVQAGFALYYAPTHRFTDEKDIERFVFSKPAFAIGSMVLWYALLFLFLYVTLSVLRGFPFWRSLGWRGLPQRSDGHPRRPWLFFFAGCGLSVLVAIATAKMQPPQDVPIEELFRYKNTAMLFMAMAVLIAPLVEETIFRGYLYPLFAKSFGIASGIILTGVLFGLMHGAQLGWTWGLVGILTAVGVIFTFVRARTGSVLASFLLHLGYNSTIAVFTIVGTKGFTSMPPTH